MGFFRLGKDRDQSERALADAESQRQRLSAERDGLLVALEREQRRAQEADGRAREADGRARAAEARAERAERSAAEARAEADAATAGRSQPDLAGGSLDACWPLVIAHLERRWAAGMGALPGARGVTPGPLPAQLTESLAREVDRLREEVGVDVSFSVARPVEPANPVVFLLTATDLLGAMASRCERVTVELSDRLVVTGEMWSDLDDELDAWRQRAVQAGAVIDPVDVGDEQVQVTVHP